MNTDLHRIFCHEDFSYFPGLLLPYDGIDGPEVDPNSIHQGPLTADREPTEHQAKTAEAMKRSIAERKKLRADRPPRVPTTILPPGDYEPIVCVTCGQPAKHEAFGKCRRCYGVEARARRTAARNLRELQAGL